MQWMNECVRMIKSKAMYVPKSRVNFRLILEWLQRPIVSGVVGSVARGIVACPHWRL